MTSMNTPRIYHIAVSYNVGFIYVLLGWNTFHLIGHLDSHLLTRNF